MTTKNLLLSYISYCDHHHYNYQYSSSYYYYYYYTPRFDWPGVSPLPGLIKLKSFFGKTIYLIIQWQWPITFWCLWWGGPMFPPCRDMAPEGSTLEESNRNLDQLTDLALQLQAQTGVQVLWVTCNLFAHPRSAGVEDTHQLGQCCSGLHSSGVILRVQILTLMHKDLKHS